MKLTLLQMMKVVAGFAFATAYVLPLVRLVEAKIASWPSMLVVGAIGVPLVFALTAIVLGRNGPAKDWLVRFLYMTSVGVGVSCVGSALAMSLWIWVQHGMPADFDTLAQLAVIGLLLIAFGLMFIWLMRVLVSTRRDITVLFRAGHRAE